MIFSLLAQWFFNNFYWNPGIFNNYLYTGCFYALDSYEVLNCIFWLFSKLNDYIFIDSISISMAYIFGKLLRVTVKLYAFIIILLKNGWSASDIIYFTYFYVIVRLFSYRNGPRLGPSNLCKEFGAKINPMIWLNK